MTRYGLFCFDSLGFAIPLLRLQKIVYRYPGYRLPKLPEVVAEVIVDQGQLIPLLSLSGLPGVETASARNAEYKVVAESEGGFLAFPADITCGIVAETKGKRFPEQDLSAGITELFGYQEKVYKILDIDFLALEMTRVS